MAGHAKKCVERYCELANKTTQQLYKVSTPCIDDHHFKEEEIKSVGELSHVCSQIVLKCLYLARIGRPNILWSVNKLARSITKWTKACDKRLNRLISYIHHTCEYRQYCHVGNTVKQCRLGLLQDSDIAGDLEVSKSTSGGTLCVFGSHTFVPISEGEQKWSTEKLHLENARKLRGIYFIDPEDTEFKETIKNARKKLETSVALAMPCKIMKNCGSGGSNKIKTNLRVSWKPVNQQDCVWENLYRIIMKTILQERETIHCTHYNLVHKFVLMPQAMKIPAAKAAVDKEWEKLEKKSAWNLTKIRSKKEVIDEARTSGAKFILHH